MLNRVEDVPRVTLDLASQLLHGLDAGMRRAPIPFLQAVPGRFKGHFEDLGWGAKFGSDDFELKGHLLSMVV